MTYYMDFLFSKSFSGHSVANRGSRETGEGAVAITGDRGKSEAEKWGVFWRWRC